MDNIRFILIIALSTIILMLWQAWQADYGPEPETAKTETASATLKADVPESLNAHSQSGETEQNKQSVAASPESKVVESSKIITVKTDVYNLEIDTIGGTLRNLDLLAYPVEKENKIVNKLRATLGFEPEQKNLKPIRLLDGSAERLFLAQSGLIASRGSELLPNHHTEFQVDKENFQLDPDQNTLRVPLVWRDGKGMKVIKTYIFTRGSNLITLQQKVINDSDKDWTGSQYNQLLRLPYKDKKKNTFIRTYTGGVVYTNEDKYQKIKFDDMADENLNVTTKGGWSAIIQHYFASAWIPPADQENHFYTKELKNSHYVIGSYSPVVTVPANSEHIFAEELYEGPKIQTIMEKIAPGLELTVDYGWLTIIGKPIYWLLNKIHSLIGNWGWSILGVTLFIKTLFFKLSDVSYRSMAKMRKLQPKLKALKDRFGDDRQRFNTEMMALYKKEKVNPMGGCLPILVQIPVFISLYWVLIETVELRQAPFVLWIQDLSAQDPFFVLPVLMGITMKIQQSLNPAPVDPLQAKVIKMFPVVFTVFFLFFPAGLVVYWVMNNSLSIIQQWIITKNIEKED